MDEKIQVEQYLENLSNNSHSIDRHGGSLCSETSFDNSQEVNSVPLHQSESNNHDELVQEDEIDFANLMFTELDSAQTNNTIDVKNQENEEIRKDSILNSSSEKEDTSSNVDLIPTHVIENIEDDDLLGLKRFCNIELDERQWDSFGKIPTIEIESAEVLPMDHVPDKILDSSVYIHKTGMSSMDNVSLNDNLRGLLGIKTKSSVNDILCKSNIGTMNTCMLSEGNIPSYEKDKIFEDKVKKRFDFIDEEDLEKQSNLKILHDFEKENNIKNVTVCSVSDENVLFDRESSLITSCYVEDILLSPHDIELASKNDLKVAVFNQDLSNRSKKTEKESSSFLQLDSSDQKKDHCDEVLELTEEPVASTVKEGILYLLASDEKTKSFKNKKIEKLSEIKNDDTTLSCTDRIEDYLDVTMEPDLSLKDFAACDIKDKSSNPDDIILSTHQENEKSKDSRRAITSTVKDDRQIEKTLTNNDVEKDEPISYENLGVTQEAATHELQSEEFRNSNESDDGNKLVENIENICDSSQSEVLMEDKSANIQNVCLAHSNNSDTDVQDLQNNSDNNHQQHVENETFEQLETTNGNNNILRSELDQGRKPLSDLNEEFELPTGIKSSVSEEILSNEGDNKTESENPEDLKNKEVPVDPKSKQVYLESNFNTTVLIEETLCSQSEHHDKTEMDDKILQQESERDSSFSKSHKDSLKRKQIQKSKEIKYKDFIAPVKGRAKVNNKKKISKSDAEVISMNVEVSNSRDSIYCLRERKNKPSETISTHPAMKSIIRLKRKQELDVSNESILPNDKKSKCSDFENAVNVESKLINKRKKGSKRSKDSLGEKYSLSKSEGLQGTTTEITELGIKELNNNLKEKEVSDYDTQSDCTVITTHGDTIFIQLKSANENVAVLNSDYCLVLNGTAPVTDNNSSIVIFNGSCQDSEEPVDIKCENKKEELNITLKPKQAPPTLEPFWNENENDEKINQAIPVLEAEKHESKISMKDGAPINNKCKSKNTSKRKRSSKDSGVRADKRSPSLDLERTGEELREKDVISFEKIEKDTRVSARVGAENLHNLIQKSSSVINTSIEDTTSNTKRVSKLRYHEHNLKSRSNNYKSCTESSTSFTGHNSESNTENQEVVNLKAEGITTTIDGEISTLYDVSKDENFVKNKSHSRPDSLSKCQGDEYRMTKRKSSSTRYVTENLKNVKTDLKVAHDVKCQHTKHKTKEIYKSNKTNEVYETDIRNSNQSRMNKRKSTENKNFIVEKKQPSRNNSSENIKSNHSSNESKEKSRQKIKLSESSSQSIIAEKKKSISLEKENIKDSKRKKYNEKDGAIHDCEVSRAIVSEKKNKPKKNMKIIDAALKNKLNAFDANLILFKAEEDKDLKSIKKIKTNNVKNTASEDKAAYDNTTKAAVPQKEKKYKCDTKVVRQKEHFDVSERTPMNIDDEIEIDINEILTREFSNKSSEDNLFYKNEDVAVTSLGETTTCINSKSLNLGSNMPLFKAKKRPNVSKKYLSNIANSETDAKKTTKSLSDTPVTNVTLNSGPKMSSLGNEIVYNENEYNDTSHDLPSVTSIKELESLKETKPLVEIFSVDSSLTTSSQNLSKGNLAEVQDESSFSKSSQRNLIHEAKLLKLSNNDEEYLNETSLTFTSSKCDLKTSSTVFNVTASTISTSDPFAVLLNDVTNELKSAYSKKMSKGERKCFSPLYQVSTTSFRVENSTPSFSNPHVNSYSRIQKEIPNSELRESEKFISGGMNHKDHKRDLSPFSERKLKANHENPLTINHSRLLFSDSIPSEEMLQDTLANNTWQTDSTKGYRLTHALFSPSETDDSQLSWTKSELLNNSELGMVFRDSKNLQDTENILDHETLCEDLNSIRRSIEEKLHLCSTPPVAHQLTSELSLMNLEAEDPGKSIEKLDTCKHVNESSPAHTNIVDVTSQVEGIINSELEMENINVIQNGTSQEENDSLSSEITEEILISPENVPDVICNVKDSSINLIEEIPQNFISSVSSEEIIKLESEVQELSSVGIDSGRFSDALGGEQTNLLILNDLSTKVDIVESINSENELHGEISTKELNETNVDTRPALQDDMRISFQDVECDNSGQHFTESQVTENRETYNKNPFSVNDGENDCLLNYQINDITDDSTIRMDEFESGTIYEENLQEGGTMSSEYDNITSGASFVERRGTTEEENMLRSSIDDWPYTEEEVVTQDSHQPEDLKVKLLWSRIFDLDKEKSLGNLKESTNSKGENESSIEFGPVAIKLNLNSSNCYKVSKIIMKKRTDMKSLQSESNKPVVDLMRIDVIEDMIRNNTFSININDIVSCDFCDRQLLCQKSLEQHIHDLHTVHDCSACHQSFPGNILFSAHKSTHPELHHCLLCQKTFTNIEKYKSHEQTSIHRQLESLQRQTIHMIYQQLRGTDCPTLKPLSREEIMRLNWRPYQPDTLHNYHSTPLDIVLQQNQSADSLTIETAQDNTHLSSETNDGADIIPTRYQFVRDETNSDDPSDSSEISTNTTISTDLN